MNDKLIFFKNKLYNCDNLELMSIIPDNTIDLIYCDILYGTGRKFKDFQDLKPIRSEIEDHYIPRLKEMHRILKNTGSIYLQMDAKINHWIRIIMDDIFGYNNFRNEIIWKKGETGKGAKKFKNISKDHDSILQYTKSNVYTVNFIKEPHDTISLKEYKYYDDIERKYFKIVQLGMYSKISVENMRKKNEIYTSKNGKDYKKYYLEDFKNGIVSDIWVNCHSLYNGDNKEMNIYDTQKPQSLLERIILLSSNEGDLIADFYCGSGTTCETATLLNRNFVACDINPKAIEISNKRLNKK